MRFLLKTIFWALTLVSAFFALCYWSESNTTAAICFSVLGLISLTCVYGVKHRCPNCHKWFVFSESDRTVQSREPYKVAKGGNFLFKTIYNVKYKCSSCGHLEERLRHETEKED